MLENMNRVLERIDALSKSFSGMGRRHVSRQNQTFANAMHEATKNEASLPDKDDQAMLAQIKNLSSSADLQTMLNRQNLPLAMANAITPANIQQTRSQADFSTQQNLLGQMLAGLNQPEK